jgi:hypothetical protein
MSKKAALSLVLVAVPVVLVGCSTADVPPKVQADNTTSGAGGDSSGTSGTSGTMDTSGTSGSSGTSGTNDTGSGGSATGTGGSGASGSSAGGSSGTDDAAAPISFDGGTNFVPPDYKGTPFMMTQTGMPNRIPGNIHMADYDLGGAGVAYCHSNPANCAGGIKMTDWDCGPGKGGDHRKDPNCPPYRPDNDNAGLCHMNTGEPDNTTTGQPYMPYYPYVCYTSTGEWLKYTVQVTEAGTYSIGGAMAVPDGTTIELDFGNGITTGTIMLPTSPTNMCKCPETYHSWETVTGLGTVMFPAAGTYLMTMTIKSQQYNPEYFSFTKM